MRMFASRSKMRLLRSLLALFFVTSLMICMLLEQTTDTCSQNLIHKALDKKADKTNAKLPSSKKVDSKPYVLPPVPTFTSFQEALLAVADKENKIILAQVDDGFLEMAFNFYEVSLKPHNITNFLFVGVSSTTCPKLLANRLPCYKYRDDKAGSSASVYHSKDFLRKMNIRTDMVLDALQLNLTVLHTDLDIVYFKNPFLHIPCGVSCDIAALRDSVRELNAGFIYIRPTLASRLVYQHMQQLAKKKPKMDDQDQLRESIIYVRKGKTNVTADTLSQKSFLTGLQYFEKGNRTFADGRICKECVVVHNNWIVSYEAKVYRFKENHLWLYDGGKYYSSMNRTYLTYDNPMISSNTTLLLSMQKKALVSALAIGQILNRTVILPAFRCGKKNTAFCGLNTYFKVRSLDSIFKDKYREHTFLSHPKVPRALKDFSSKADPNLIATKCTRGAGVIWPNSTKSFHPASPDLGATPSEIVSWFGTYSGPLLKFHSLYGAFWRFSDPIERTTFNKKIKSGIIDSGYRQFG